MKSSTFSPEDRARYINEMQYELFDVVIIGGGITGAGVARDAASRGMQVALVEADDFASGTSSRSSKLIHGGIRYLENLEFGLVFEALSERRKLFEMAPTLVHPLRFVLPLFEGDRVGMFKMSLGMWLYDILALFEAPEMHARLTRENTIEQFPVLRPQGLKGAFAYYDAYMDDDRLVLETLRSAARWGAKAVNYIRAVDAEKDTCGKVSALKVKDQLTGKDFKIRGRHFVSSVGPWTDDVAHSLLKEWQDLMRPSKGIHLTFSRDRLPLKDAVVMAADQQKRIVFAIPRHEMVIVGTTDTDYEGDPGAVKSEVSDVRYLLQIINEYFPGAEIKEEDIIASYSGVRPLVDDGSSSESKTSREHLIINDSRNITFVTGGKYTTYRNMAKEAVESFLGQFPIEDQVKFARSTTDEPLNSRASVNMLRKAMQKVEMQSGIPESSKPVLRWLVERHGDEAFDLWADIEAWQNSDLQLWQRVWKAEARHAIKYKMCMNIRDFYLRRSPLFLSRKDHGFGYLDVIAAAFGEELGVKATDLTEQIEALQHHLRTEMGWRQNL